MIKVAITGVIGSGKSTIAQLLKNMGIPLIDADEISRASTKKGGAAYDKIIALFGPDILLENGEIDRKKLAHIVFSDSKKRLALEAVVHPAVKMIRDQMIKELEKKNEKIVVLDIPLLFETGMEKEVDYVILAYADEKTLFDRVHKRDNMSFLEFEKRLKNQIPLSEKVKKSHFIVDTRKDLKLLEKELAVIVNKIVADT